MAVALGNWLASNKVPPEEAVAVLRDALEDKESVVREHAAWAIETLPNTRVDSQARWSLHGSVRFRTWDGE